MENLGELPADLAAGIRYGRLPTPLPYRLWDGRVFEDRFEVADLRAGELSLTEVWAEVHGGAARCRPPTTSA